MRILTIQQTNGLNELLWQTEHTIIDKRLVEREHLELVEEFQPHLIIVGAERALPVRFFPIISGIELCRELRTRYSAAQLPIVITPRYPESQTPEVWEEAWRAGANLVFWLHDYEGLFQALQPFLRPEKSLSRY